MGASSMLKKIGLLSVNRSLCQRRQSMYYWLILNPYIWTQFEWKKLVSSAAASDCYVEGELVYIQTKTDDAYWFRSERPPTSKMQQILQYVETVKVSTLSGREEAFLATVKDNARLSIALKLLKLLDSLDTITCMVPFAGIYLKNTCLGTP